MDKLLKYAKSRMPDQKRTNVVWLHLYEISIIGKSMVTESRLVVASG